MSTQFLNPFRRVQKRPHLALSGLAVLAVGSAVSVARAQPPPAKPVIDTTQYQRAFDIFAGQNKTGPYTLGWNAVHVALDDKPTVVVNGTTLPQIAYEIDSAKGTIVFSNPLKSDQVARVAYSYNPAASQRNTNPATVPLSVNVLQFGGTDFKVTALPSSSGGTDLVSRPLVWSLSKKTGLLGGGLTSDINYSGQTGAAFKMGYAQGNDKNGVTANFAQTGREFAENAGKAFNAASAGQTWDASGKIRPANWMGLTIARRELRDMSWNKGGVGTNNQAYNLFLGGDKRIPTLNVSRVEESSLPGSQAKITDSTTTTTDKIDFAGAVGGIKGGDSVAKVTANLAQAATDAPATAGDTKADQLAVSVSAQTPDKKGTASLAVADANKTTATTNEDKQNIAVKIAPAPLISVSAEQKTQINGPSNTVINTAQAAVDAARAKGDDKAQTDAEAALKKLTNTEVTTQSAQAEIKPLPNTKLTGSVQTTKTEAVGAAGGDGGPKSSVTVQSAQAELAPLPNTKIAGSVQTIKTEKSDDPDAVKSSVTELSAQIGTGKAFEIAGGITNRSATSTGNETADAMATLNTSRARLALRPFGPAVILTGGYTVNPLDKNNQILNGQRKEFGLDTKIGALSLGSGYALTRVSPLFNDDPDADTSSGEYGEVSLTLGLRFSRYTQLTGNYKDALMYGNADARPLAGLPRASRAYGLGLTHQVGSGVSFMMGGTVARDPALTGKPADIKGEAKLGLKF